MCEGKTLRGSIVETISAAARFIDQVSLYSNGLCVAIAQGPTPLMQVARSGPPGPARSRRARRAIPTGGCTACQQPFLLYLEQSGSDFLIAMEHSLRLGSQVIRNQLTYGRKA